MKESKTASGETIHDVLGIGLGPANLALAVALEEEGGRDLQWLFLERQMEVTWHQGMLIEDSLLQSSVLKDLVLIRNPRSRFTFLSYLKVKGRLFEFLNLRDLYPTRLEFNDYLGWAASELGERVRYGREVAAVQPVMDDDGEVELLRVECVDALTGERERYLTRNLVVATGGTPWAPAGIELRPGSRAFHSDEVLLRLERDYPDRNAPYRFLVVGSGQSGAELFHHLITRYRRADVTATVRRFAYKPVDASHFTNQIFFPESVDLLFGLPEEKRRMVYDDCRDVNYAVVDMPLIRQIYQDLYKEKLHGRDRARIRSYFELQKIEETATEVKAHFRDLLYDRDEVLSADGMVLCTGYSWGSEHPLLAELAPWLERDRGGYKVLRDYRVASGGGFAPGVFLQGCAESTHGASETVMSLMAIRAGDILASLLSRLSAPASAPSFVL
jgi:L-ornithine N5-oxygenase